MVLKKLISAIGALALLTTSFAPSANACHRCRPGKRVCCHSRVIVHVCDVSKKDDGRDVESGDPGRQVESGPAPLATAPTVVPSMAMPMHMMMMPFMPSVMPVSYQQQRQQEAGGDSSCCTQLSRVRDELENIVDELKKMSDDLDVLSNQVNGHGKAIEGILDFLVERDSEPELKFKDFLTEKPNADTSTP